jgi:FKBP-type peptidyl-prolyl cis-trans isomerase SlyD
MPKKIICVEYELKSKDGKVIESSRTTGPLRFVPGRGELLAALESQITALSVGEEQRGEIPADALLPSKTIPLAEFPGGAQLTVGQTFEAKDRDGHPVQFKIIGLDDTNAIVRFLHPIGEQDLEFWVKVVNIEVKAPPPLPAAALGIDSAAIQLCGDSARIQLAPERLPN